MNAATTKTLTPLIGSSNNLSGTSDRNKQWQRELLMERIRSHSTQQKSFPELSKAMRMSMLEKRYALDAVEKSNLQKCLDNMQHCIKVTSRQGLVERLESLSRQLGLKFMEDASGLFISTDMFYLEIILDGNGVLTDVKVHHECKIEQQSCSELVNCLNRGDFADFTAQLEGLSSIYQLNAEPKVKTKAFVALQAMETDLYNLFQAQTFSKDTQQVLQDSSVGIVLKRRGGHPMKLTYFVSPYDLISLESKSMQPLSIDLITNKQIGFSVTVNLEASSANKLQILPTITLVKDAQSNIEVPVYAPLTQLNSMLLPATFVLRLNKPLPVCFNTLRLLSAGALGGAADNSSNTTGLESQHKVPIISSIMSLIVQTASEQAVNNLQKGLFVCLPDQTHCYFLTENKQLKTALVSSIPFTEPVQVPRILSFLKQQALFYTLLSSCVRSQSKMGNDMDSTTILEASATSFEQISVSLQHSYEESMATIDFDLRNGIVTCTIFSPNQNYDILSLKLTKAAQKSLSIPVTIRALLKYWDQERLQIFHRGIGSLDSGLDGGLGGIGGGKNSTNGMTGGGFGNFSLIMGPNDTGGRVGNNSNNDNLKLESNARQHILNALPPITSTTLPEAIKFKNHVKKEDFLESPKSQSSIAKIQSVEINSLGYNQDKEQKTGSLFQQQHNQQATAIRNADIEIAGKYKNIWKNKTTNLKNCVSITPIPNEIATTTSVPQQKNIADVKQRITSGIEIIPLITQNHVVPNNSNIGVGSGSTITITPINNSGSVFKDKKTLPNSILSVANPKRLLDTTLSIEKEKKRKKKRDDSPMGPPEKVYSRQNSPASTNDASTTAAVSRKFSSPSSSPKGASGGLLSSSVAGSGSLSTRPSPKHSPVYSSPKHNTSSNSPKSPFGTQSPKHGSSGKPSMSTLKSAAATSLSPKSGASSSDVKCTSNLLGNASVGVKNREKDKTSTLLIPNSTGLGSSSSMNSMMGLSTVSSAGSSATGVFKSVATIAASMSQLKGSAPSSSALHHNVLADNLSSGFIGSASSASTLELNAAMRKSLTSAVSLMTSTAASTVLTTVPATTVEPITATTATATTMVQQHGSNEVIERQNIGSSEYMVKSSHEGLKLTINKTSSKSNISKTNNSSPTSGNCVTSGKTVLSSSLKKQHTGLKPGVSSGPASKKTTTGTSTLIKNITATDKTTMADDNLIFAGSSALPTLPYIKKSSQNIKHTFQKSNSSGNLTLKSTGNNPRSTIVGLSKCNSASSFNELMAKRKSHLDNLSKKSIERERDRERTSNNFSSASQPATRLDQQLDMLKILQYASPAMTANMEGFIKGLSSKFHIPKLSQRALANTSPSILPLSVLSTTTTVTTTATTTTTNTSSTNLENISSSTSISTATQDTTMNITSTKLISNAKVDTSERKPWLNVTSESAIGKTSSVQQQQKQKQQESLKMFTSSSPPPYHLAVCSENKSTMASLSSSIATPIVAPTSTFSYLASSLSSMSENSSRSSALITPLKSNASRPNVIATTTSSSGVPSLPLALTQPSTVEILKNLVVDEAMIASLDGD